MSTSDNKRIAKNTALLYVRMLFVMFVSLYTVRIVLNSLGDIDYGIYNVVGGVVVLFSFLSNSLASASQRFFAYELGRNDYKRLSVLFSNIMMLYVLVSIVIVFFSETLGLWFVYNKMTIPPERMQAAFWIYQFSIVSFLATILATPFQALIIAHERMNAYAYIGVSEALLLLVLSLALRYSPFDLLVTYGVFMLVKIVLVSGAYIIYSLRHFKESRHRPSLDKAIFVEITSYSGWSLFGGMSTVARSQGLNVLLNVFFTPVVNTARGIAYQINNAINQFVHNFYTACRPQITKLYAQNNEDGMMHLVFQTSRLCFYLTWVLALPILVGTDFILSLWLGRIPEHTILFTRLVIATAIVDSISYPFQAAIAATGNVRNYYIVTGSILIITLPIAYIFLFFGCEAYSALVVSLVMAILSQFARVYFMVSQLSMQPSQYCKKVLLPILKVLCVSLALIGCITLISPVSLLNIVLSFLIAVVISFYCGMNHHEQQMVRNVIRKKITSFYKHDEN